ncbi:uncharacterized protein EI90DRAFT_1040077 [Cantharellus anzutake]|uniref:uncharacterized protein n=1 Tax=Cantharellus anzutake TaxID=1750568 RepID=UPI0019083786|nr:uncharacterized protein EI90DRAFT_1040077 [Cantharellus anzutake]KAF8311229.1 hypothetical protein EI90DRAFT_1040077 [Cantharellus anzutake]
MHYQIRGALVPCGRPALSVLLGHPTPSPLDLFTVFIPSHMERLLQVDDRILDGQVAIPHNRAWSFGVIYEGTYNTEKVCIKAFRYIDRDPVSEFLHRLVREMRVWRQLTNTHS